MNQFLKKLALAGSLSALLFYTPLVSANDEGRGRQGGGGKGNSGAFRGNGGGQQGNGPIRGGGGIQGGGRGQAGGVSQSNPVRSGGVIQSNPIRSGGVIQSNPIRSGGVIQSKPIRSGGVIQSGAVIQSGGKSQGGGKPQSGGGKPQGGGVIPSNPIRGGGVIQGGGSVKGNNPIPGGGVLQGGGGAQAGGLQKRPERNAGPTGNQGTKNPIGPITRDNNPKPDKGNNPNNKPKDGGIFKDPKLPGSGGTLNPKTNDGRPPRILDDVPKTRNPNNGNILPGGKSGTNIPGRSNTGGQPIDPSPGTRRGDGNVNKGKDNNGLPNNNTKLPLEKRPDRQKNTTKVQTVLKNQAASRFNDNLKNALSEQSPELKNLLGNANRGNAGNGNRNPSNNPNNNNNNNAQRMNKAQWNQWQAQNWNRNLNRYHQSWYRGTWGGFNSWYLPYGVLYGIGGLGSNYGYGGYGSGYGGYGNGYGGFGNSFGFVNPWLYNSLAYRYGYRSYFNPYCTHVHTYPYNYTQPIYLVSYSTSPTYSSNSYSVISTSETTIQNQFSSARTAMRNQDYTSAISILDEIIESNPSDTVAHEMRALALFAVGNYGDAAATLNSLLSVAPGWNWDTMAGFYANVDTYTAQLRKLESFASTRSDDAASQFVLAYHYLVTNYPDAARAKLQRVVELQPRDKVSQELLKGLSRGEDAQEEIPPPIPNSDVEEVRAPDVALDLVGTWKGTREDQPFELTLDDTGNFTWITGVDQEKQTITGTYSLAGDALTLNDGTDGLMVARLTATSQDGFNFALVGAPKDDKGIDFTRNATLVVPNRE
jgi:Tetratricopeptide repeat